MAGTISYLSKITIGFINNSMHCKLTSNGCRMLYTEASLGLTDYRHVRETYYDRYKNSLNSFRIKMKESIETERSLIFTEDLKALIHIVEKNPDDLELLKAALEKFNDQDKEIRFGQFKFGPVVMRCFYHLNEPNIALETFKNPKFESFYDQQTTFAILADLLYENGMYHEVIEIYEVIRTKFPSGLKNPKMVISVLAMACYKANTPESLQFGLKVFKDMTDKGTIPLRRVISTLAALAIKQNAPHYALELLAVCMKADYISIRSLKIMALCELGRLDDVLREIEATLKRGMPQKNRYFSDVVLKIEAAMLKTTTEQNAEIRELLELLKARDYIDSKTIEQHISEPLDVSKGPVQAQKQYSEYGWTQPRRRKDNWYTDENKINEGYRSNESGGYRKNYGSGGID